MAVEQLSPTYDHRQREDWLEWFLDPNVTDDNFIAALRSVPQEHWLFVEVRLRAALNQAKMEVLPAVSYSFPRPQRRDPVSDKQKWDVLQKKEYLFFDEVWRRQGEGAASR